MVLGLKHNPSPMLLQLVTDDLIATFSFTLARTHSVTDTLDIHPKLLTTSQCPSMTLRQFSITFAHWIAFIHYFKEVFTFQGVVSIYDTDKQVQKCSLQKWTKISDINEELGVTSEQLLWHHRDHCSYVALTNYPNYFLCSISNRVGCHL